MRFFKVTAYLDYTTTVYNENSIHHFWDGDRDVDVGEGHALNAGKQLQRSFTKDAKMMHREMNDICITVYILENQVNNMWNMRTTYRSKRHLGKEVRPKTCSSSPTTKLLEASCLPLKFKENMGNVIKISHKTCVLIKKM